LAAGEIEAVVIAQEKIIGRLKSKNDSTVAASSVQIAEGPSTPWRLRLDEIEREMARQVEVIRLPDEMKRS